MWKWYFSKWFPYWFCFFTTFYELNSSIVGKDLKTKFKYKSTNIFINESLDTWQIKGILILVLKDKLNLVQQSFVITHKCSDSTQSQTVFCDL